MKPFIYEICSYIADNTDLTFGSGDKDLKVGDINRNENGIYALNAPSEEPDRYTPVEYQNVDFWSHYVSSEEGYNKLVTIKNLLHQGHHYNTDSYYVYASTALGTIEDMDRTQENRKMWRIGILFIYKSLIY